VSGVGGVGKNVYAFSDLRQGNWVILEGEGERQKGGQNMSKTASNWAQIWNLQEPKNDWPKHNKVYGGGNGGRITVEKKEKKYETSTRETKQHYGRGIWKGKGRQLARKNTGKSERKYSRNKNIDYVSFGTNGERGEKS